MIFYTNKVIYMQAVFESSNIDILIKKDIGISEYRPMFHLHIEILYVVSGSVRVTIDGVLKTVKAGEISIVFPFSIHSYEKSDAAEIILLLLRPTATGVFEKTLLNNKPKRPYLVSDSITKTLIERIFELNLKSDNLSKMTLSMYIVSLIGEILLRLTFIDSASTDIDMMQKVLIYCSEHFSDDISIETVAANLFISKSYVTKIFSKKLKVHFREYINILRISRAKTLLENTGIGIADIMDKCGFQNQSSFNRVFAKLCGMTPKKYRELNGR